MAQAFLRNLIDKLTARAIRERLDKRRLQAEIDTHRLFLLTSLHARRASGEKISDALADDLDAAAQRMGYEGMSKEVAAHLNSQFAALAGAMHKFMQHQDSLCPAAARLLEGGTAETPKHRIGGLAMATGADGSLPPTAVAPQQAAAPDQQRRQSVTMQQIAVAVQEATGYSVNLATSAVWQAGRGLWLQGTAPAGSLVALYPGVCYDIAHHRDIPGYPRVDRDNSFLVSRFDGSILDGKAWGSGLEGAGAMWPAASRSAAERALQHLEGRNPFALAHFANHPAPEEQPNVMLAPIDLEASGAGGQLRAYLPNLNFSACGNAGNETEWSRHRAVADSPGRGLALVALQDIKDEEVLLNYRLSPGMARPDWYMPVDDAEERRRWA